MIIDVRIVCRRHRDVVLDMCEIDSSSDEHTVTVDSCDKCIAEETEEIQEKNNALHDQNVALTDQVEILGQKLSDFEP